MLDTDAALRAAIAAGRRPIRTIGSDVPRDLLRAAGFQPIRMAADEAALCDPAAADIPVLLTSTRSEHVQLFATAREIARLGEAVLPPLHLLDRCHQPRPSSARYEAQRIAELQAWLAMQRPGAPLAVWAAEDDARVAALDALRRDARIAGTDALRLSLATEVLPLEEWRAAADAVLAEAAGPRDGVRLFVTGSAIEPATYAAIETLGATIVGEWHDHGLRRPPVPLPAADPRQVAADAVVTAQACGASHILHLTAPGDEAAPWTVAPLARLRGDRPFRTLAIDDLDGIARFLSGEPDPVRAPPQSRTAAPKPADNRSRSRKSLTSVADFGTYQREWFADVRARAAAGEPFAMVNANAPQEILRALDIPFVVNQWWASIVAAKQQSRRYLSLLKQHDLPTRIEAYSAQGLAAAFDEDADAAPWGGLPRPDFVHAVLSSDATAGIFANWADATGAAPFLHERSVDPNWTIATDWWADLPDGWDDALEPARLDLTTAELEVCVAHLEAATGRTFDRDRFVAVMHLVNEQEDYYRRTRDLIARTVPAPIGIVDSMPATMVPQWHRGTEWARDAARAFYEEVAARVASGAAAVPNERIRLMWVGRGMWSEMGFYQNWEESHGAVFVWSMYLALAADGYIRRFDRGRDPMRALAARFITMGDELRMPSWAAPWHVHQAQTHGIDGAVALADADPFVLRALRAAGIPVLDLGVDNFNREGDDAAAIDAAITAFIEGPAAAMAEARARKAAA